MPKQWTLQSTLRLRMYRNASSFRQIFSQVQAQQAWRPRLQPILGYTLLANDFRDRPGRQVHSRHTAGLASNWLERPAFSLTGRSLVEYNTVLGGTDYFRFRHRETLQAERGAWRPFLYAEGLRARQINFWWLGAGVARDLAPWCRLTLGVESRHNADRTYSHILTTGFLFRRVKK